MTNEMQAKIPHFGAGFLRRNAFFSRKVKTIDGHWKNLEAQNKNNAPEMQKQQFWELLAVYWTQTPRLSKKEKNHASSGTAGQSGSSRGGFFASRRHPPPLLHLLHLFSVLR
ncbi:MAG: hypothetical protein K2L38_05140 [Dysosmobacter sp.]|nr:hypothetical protein [Dysosmobacter sp.]